MDGSRHGLPRSNVKKYKRKNVVELPHVISPVEDIQEIIPMQQSEINRILDRILKTDKAQNEQ